MPPPRPHPLTRSGAAEWADRLLDGLWDRGVTPKPPLDPEFLWEKGADGFEPEHALSVRASEDAADFRERLEVLCASLRDEAGLNALGHTMAYGQITAAIRKRHALGRLWLEQPSIAETPLAPPIIVVGQMRAGTTRMHRLLAADPRHAGTRFCNAFDPVPPRPPFTDARPLKAVFALAVARTLNPWLDTLHPFGTTRPDEEIHWLSHALNPCAYEAQWRIPAYVAFSEARDAAPVYREFARILRTDAAVMGNAALPRVLKCPQFCEDLPALLGLFPEARLVVTHRDTGEVLESAVSMAAAQMAPQSDSLDLGAIRNEWSRKIALRESRMEQALAAWDGPVSHVAFAELNAGWEGEIARVYRELGLALTDETLAAMRKEQRRGAKGQHRGHRKQIEGFGA